MIDLFRQFLGEESLQQFFSNQNIVLLFVCIAALLAVLGKSADKLVGEAVVLSERSGLPKVVIGATVVSLGTTSPEAAVSVLAALQGKPDLALGNAVGSIICDTGLILGIACLIEPPVLHRSIVNRQGWLQFAAGVLLIAACLPLNGDNPFETGGVLPRTAGVLFVLLLLGYMWLSVRWAKHPSAEAEDAVERVEEFETHVTDTPTTSLPLVLLKLLAATLLVVLASHVLIPGIGEAAERMGVPPTVVAATLVAFGTSLPELVTAVTASLKKHGDLAIGNVIGADILNVLFVAGLSAAVTPGGLEAPPNVFRVMFPAMMIVLIVFRVGIAASDRRMHRAVGPVLLVTYLIYTVASFKFL